MNGPRYAIYYAPDESSALADFGRAWLGRESHSANDPPFLSLGLDAARHAKIVTDPRRYGLHATLKPPFHLAAGTKRADLTEALARFCAIQRPVDAPALTLALMDGFIALRPSGPAPNLDRLAARCVETFDRFRAPASVDEIKKRLAVGLSSRQRALLDRWGYPYVMEEFRFHISLTGRLAAAEHTEILVLLTPHLTQIAAVPLAVGSLCLFEQPDANSRFVMTARFPLSD